MAELMEGGLALLLARPLAVALFVSVDVVFTYLPLWAETRYGISLLLVSILTIGLHVLTTAMLVLALGERLRDVVSDPAELFVRLAFLLAAMLVVSLGSMLAALLFIVPGLYVAARWALVSPLVLLKGAGIMQSLNRSWELTERSAWGLVGVFVIVTIPPAALGFFSDTWTDPTFPPGPAAVFELIVGAAFAAFEVAVYVFAFRALAPEPDRLIEVFS